MTALKKFLLGLCIGSTLTLSVFACVYPSLRTVPELPRSYIIALTPWGHSLHEFATLAGWRYEELGYIRISQKENAVLHKADRIAGPGGQVYFLYYSIDDEHDGGNSYGWVAGPDGRRVGLILDSYLSLEAINETR